jgi:hypothetical protein|tara:strand:+ start:1061 stop:1222 length:162 start_codon:yes stop_codon:yes gene_type:complete
MIITFVLVFLTIAYLWILWDIILSGWENVDIDITTEELESDLINGLHLYGRDE